MNRLLEWLRDAGRWVRRLTPLVPSMTNATIPIRPIDQAALPARPLMGRAQRRVLGR